VIYLVFCSLPQAQIDEPLVLSHGEKYFSASLSVVSQRTQKSGKKATQELRIAYKTRKGFEAAYTLISRPVTPADRKKIREAETNGQVPGLGRLAHDCPWVWQVEDGLEEIQPETIQFCALLATVALGPIVPPHLDTVLSVRTARDLAANPHHAYR